MADAGARPVEGDTASEKTREVETSNSSTRTLNPRESDERQEKKSSEEKPIEPEIESERPTEKATVQSSAISANESHNDVSKQPDVDDDVDEKADIEGGPPTGPPPVFDEAEENFKPKTITFWLVILSNFVAMFLVALDRTIIATAIPRITDEFQSLGDIGWYGSAYMLTTAASQLVFGRIYKFYSLRGAFLGSILIFEIGSLICGVAPSSPVLIAGRAIAGVGSAGIFTGAMMVMIPMIPLHKRPMFQGIFGMVFGLASVIGPLVGGGFTSNVTWRWCFYINLPIGGVAFVFLFFMLKAPRRQPQEPATLFQHFKRLDPLGTFFFVPSVVSLLLALEWGGSEYAWNDGRIIALFVVFGVAFMAFAAVQVFMPKTATVPVRIIKQRTMLAGAFFMLFLAGSMMLAVYYLPIWFQAVQGANPVNSGIYTIPLVLSIVVSSIISGGATQKIGYYVPSMILCPCIMSVGLGLMSTFQPGISSGHWIGYQFLTGFGLGFGMQTVGLAVQAVLPKEDVSTGVSISFFAQQLGAAIFVSVGQSILSNLLVSELSGIPGLSAQAIVNTGATNLHTVVPAQFLDVVVRAYNYACTRIFLAGMGLSLATLICALFMEWKNIKKNKKLQRAKQRASQLRPGDMGAIRRIKCGEERPACSRCTSTGRACDGYDKSLPVRPRDSDALVPQALLIRVLSESQNPRLLRPLVADIDGTHTERVYFHRFRRMAEAGLSNHVTNLTSFWSRIATQLSHSDDAVKHAIVALGSAHHMYQTAPPRGGEAPPRELEIFTIQQYGTAMSKLSSYAHVPMKDRITVTLLCCVSFVCIESLRNNWRPALTHLSNGLRIIESLPMSKLNELRGAVPANASADPSEDVLSMDYILRLFATWEISCALFAENFKPVIAIKLYEGRELDDTLLDEFKTIADAHRAIVQYTRDVFALVWLTKEQQGDDEFWARPVPHRQHRILMERGNHLTGLFQRFMERPQAPASGTKEHHSICLDMLHYKCARLICETLHQKPHQRQQSPDVVAQHAELVSLAALLHQGLVAKQRETGAMPRSFTLDIGIIPPLYFILVTCQDPVIQGKALGVLRNYPQRENLWDGNFVRNLLVTVENVSYGPVHPLKDVPHSLAFGKGIPALYEKLQELRINVEGDD
ncbi:major facilitator superfamily transporter [Colletotrichum nymphaeae SA-01]|uniref:Major facilitator superfamily transporter n=1 Tax=Colletotrichum nymphaeae SA-01 TaxID=1460502 RepID=A0A135RXU2_9PEZI|nr:major facilitator superfamily transporter [Colletotrichum nymphaeae SA-01]